jgi:NADH/F420H2 dehydrogenase subunit C
MLQTYSMKNISVSSTVRRKYLVYLGFLNLLLTLFPKGIINIFIEKNEMEVCIKKSYIPEFLNFLKDHTWAQFKVISDIIAIDYPGRADRFEVIYQLLSTRYNSRMNVSVVTDELAGIPSSCGVYKGSAWYEREVWDLYGIFFENHPDLRRILTDYSFEGHPLRKDFPLTGYFEVFYDDTKKRIVYEPVSLVQEYRYFTFSNPWLT